MHHKKSNSDELNEGNNILFPPLNCNGIVGSSYGRGRIQSSSSMTGMNLSTTALMNNLYIPAAA